VTHAWNPVLRTIEEPFIEAKLSGDGHDLGGARPARRVERRLRPLEGIYCAATPRRYWIVWVIVRSGVVVGPALGPTVEQNIRFESLWRLGHAGYEKRRISKVGQGRRNTAHHAVDLGQAIKVVNEIECDFYVIVNLAHHAPPGAKCSTISTSNKATQVKTLSTEHHSQK
jgi:hypothetical protein